MAKRGISLLLVVGAFFAIGGGQELAADDNADAIIRDGIIHSASGGNFADFRHQYQSRLLFALDGVLARQAESALTDNFAAVKKADIQLQTTLGNRKGQVAANVIGAFAESQNSAFGWQVRAFGAENDTKGANAGIFFRRVDSESLYGINTFADYEDGKYGDFLRYGIGGELQNRFAAFAINYYLPITDDKGRGATVAFSQKGFDANLRIAIPRLDFLKVRADYYLFDGKYGGEDDKGLRYGLEVQPISNLRIGAFYDDGGEKFGGDIAYIYNFGNRQLSQKRESEFAPDLFSPVLREYSQRIISTTTLQIVEVPTLTLFTTTTIPARVQRTTLGLGFMTVSMPNTVATATITDSTTMVGMTTTMFATVHTMTATRAASVEVTTLWASGVVITTFGRSRILVTLPPETQSRPYVLLGVIPATRAMNYNDARVIIGAGAFPVGNFVDFPIARDSYDITIVQGSEEFVSVVITLTTGTTRMTAADVITETAMTLSAATITRMTNTLMPTLTITMTISAMMITMPTLTLYQTITAGIPTMTIGAANVDSHFDFHSPPSFPPPIFPQVPKLALAAPVILARRAGIQPRLWRGHNRIGDYRRIFAICA